MDVKPAGEALPFHAVENSGKGRSERNSIDFVLNDPVAIHLNRTVRMTTP